MKGGWWVLIDHVGTVFVYAFDNTLPAVCEKILFPFNLLVPQPAADNT